MKQTKECIIISVMEKKRLEQRYKECCGGVDGSFK